MSRFSHVQKQQKELPYSVTPIGDAVALKHWKEFQIQKAVVREIALEPKRWEARERAAEMVSNQETNPYKHRSEDKQEIAYRKARLSAAKHDLRRSQTALEAYQATTPAIQPEETPPSALQRVIGAITKLFK